MSLEITSKVSIYPQAISALKVAENQSKKPSGFMIASDPGSRWFLKAIAISFLFETAPFATAGFLVLHAYNKWQNKMKESARVFQEQSQVDEELKGNPVLQKKMHAIFQRQTDLLSSQKNYALFDLAMSGFSAFTSFASLLVDWRRSYDFLEYGLMALQVKLGVNLFSSLSHGEEKEQLQGEIEEAKQLLLKESLAKEIPTPTA